MWPLVVVYLWGRQQLSCLLWALLKSTSRGKQVFYSIVDEQVEESPRLQRSRKRVAYSSEGRNWYEEVIESRGQLVLPIISLVYFLYRAHTY